MTAADVVPKRFMHLRDIVFSKGVGLGHKDASHLCKEVLDVKFFLRDVQYRSNVTDAKWLLANDYESNDAREVLQASGTHRIIGRVFLPCVSRKPSFKDEIVQLFKFADSQLRNFIKDTFLGGFTILLDPLFDPRHGGRSIMKEPICLGG